MTVLNSAFDEATRTGPCFLRGPFENKTTVTGAPEMCPKPESSTDVVEQVEVCGEDVNPSHPIPSKLSPGDATSCSKEGNTGHEQVTEQGVHYPPTNSHGCYLGYDVSCPKREDHNYIPSQEGLEVPCSGVQTEDIIYYMPGYDTNATGHVMAANAEYLDQQPYFSSAAYPLQTVIYGSDSVPVNSCDSKQDVGFSQTIPKILGDSNARTAGPSNSKGLNFIKAKATDDAKDSCIPLDSMQHLSNSSSTFPGQASQSLREAPHLNSGIQPVGDAKKYHHLAKVSLLSKQEQGGLLPRHRPDRSRSIGQTVNSNDRYKMNENHNLHRNYEVSSELVCGPRANRINISSSAKNISSNSIIRREHFNKSDFQIKYVQAKFFMIKSYSEDDIHKSIKYSVWASTTGGNKKLDAAFRDAEMAMKEKGAKCPIFLFFSVNASGQFVGLAEMVGPVDFKKTMDFWQRDKWTGFFPVTWHVIKDIPNRHFQNITLENNDNRAVTFSRDTQEVGLPQGLRMLFIFKGYPSGTSILDDFEFYESREKSLRTIRSSGPVLQHSQVEFDDESSSSMKHLVASFRKVGVSANAADPKPGLFNHYSSSSIDYHRRRENRS